jgi:hypothetical protein
MSCSDVKIFSATPWREQVTFEYEFEGRSVGATFGETSSSFWNQQPFSQKIVSIVTFSLKIIVRQFLSPFHRDYLTTNFNLTTKTTLTIKILP